MIIQWSLIKKQQMLIKDDPFMIHLSLQLKPLWPLSVGPHISNRDVECVSRVRPGSDASHQKTQLWNNVYQHVWSHSHKSNDLPRKRPPLPQTHMIFILNTTTPPEKKAENTELKHPFGGYFGYLTPFSSHCGYLPTNANKPGGIGSLTGWTTLNLVEISPLPTQKSGCKGEESPKKY